MTDAKRLAILDALDLAPSFCSGEPQHYELIADEVSEVMRCVVTVDEIKAALLSVCDGYD